MIILAYLGPGAGIVLSSSFVLVFTTIAAAVMSVLVWYLRLVWRRLTKLPILLAAAVLVAIAFMLLSGCGGSRASGTRVIVLGIDGMDYRVTRELMAKGRMPNFSLLSASGSFAPLATSIPPQSPVAWSSFMTGLDPGGHGIFDFVHRDPATMAPYLSTTKTEGASRNLTIGTWRFPLSSPRVTMLRDGQPFWDVLERHGVRTTIIRMPANFPPSGTASRELSGMGTPDILGTYGTSSFFTSAPDRSPAQRRPTGHRVYAVDVAGNVVHGEIAGPENPFRTPARPVGVRFTVHIDSRKNAAQVVVGGQTRDLTVGAWSDWVPIQFPLMPFQSVHGICRFYLKQVRPTFQLYVSPVNLDPMQPAMPISTPASFAADLARTTGRFYTQGMPEDTKALTEHVFTRDEFLRQAAMAGGENERQYWRVLDDFTDGLLFYYFGNLDQVSHMMWRARDPGHPAYDAARDAPYAGVIDDLYADFDRIVGDTLRRAGPDTTIVVMSDHGFTSWRRSFSLNSWLRDNGYLTVIDPDLQDDPGLFRNVDWSRTRAYGLGLNGLYVNLRGRERHGIVPAEEREALIDEIRRKLVATIDRSTGRAAVTQVFRRDPIANTSRTDVTPDLIVGYAEGTRVSNESALGAVPIDVISDNTLEWSGDHCMDPEAVPGILLTSRKLGRPAASLDRLAAALLAEFGVARDAQRGGTKVDRFSAVVTRLTK